MIHTLSAALRRAIGIGITLVLAVASPAGAQRIPRLVGSTVRITVDSGPRMTGVVVAQGVDSLTLQVKNGAAYSIVVGHLQHLERYAPQRNGVHALAGLLVGGTLGYFAGAYATNRGTARCEASPGHGDMCGLEALTLPVYTIAGALAGTAVGALLKLPHWEPLL